MSIDYQTFMIESAELLGESVKMTADGSHISPESDLYKSYAYGSKEIDISKFKGAFDYEKAIKRLKKDLETSSKHMSEIEDYLIFAKKKLKDDGLTSWSEVTLKRGIENFEKMLKTSSMNHKRITDRLKNMEDHKKEFLKKGNI